MLKLMVVQDVVKDKSYDSCSRYLGWVCTFVVACRGCHVVGISWTTGMTTSAVCKDV